MNETVLLTGISGWIAKHTAIELLKSGYKVLGTVRFWFNRANKKNHK